MAKQKFKADYYASAAKDGKDNYGTIFVSMLKHENFNAMTPSAQILYCKCRANSQDNEAKRTLYGLAQKFKLGIVLPNWFTLTTSQAKEFHVKPSNKSRYLKELEQAGFIETVLNNYKTRQANVYAFADGWKKKTELAGDAFGVDQLAENERANDSDA